MNGPNAGEPGVGQQAPQLAPSSAQGLPGSGSRPHQQAGSGSATAHDQRPRSHSQNIPAPQTEPPLEQVRPSTAQALPGASGLQGSIPSGHSAPQSQPGGVAAVSQTQSVPGGGPQQVGGQLEGSTVPGGHCHSPATQIGYALASLPHEYAQKIGAVPLQPPSPVDRASPPASSRTWEDPHEQPAARVRTSVTARRALRESDGVMRRRQQSACHRRAAGIPGNSSIPRSGIGRACADMGRGYAPPP